MRIVVMGAGSLGGYFGGMLARGGNRVTLVARGAHMHAIGSIPPRQHTWSHDRCTSSVMA